MALSTELTELEQLVGRLFYNVGVQACLGLEDPNVRFAVEFKSDRARKIPKAEKLKDIVSVTYTNKMDDGTATLVTNPKNMAALSRVLMEGGNAEAVISALEEAFAGEGTITVEEGAPFPLKEGEVIPEGAGNRFLRLVTAPTRDTNHDVAVLFAWGGASDKRITLDLMTWPMNKKVDEPS